MPKKKEINKKKRLCQSPLTKKGKPSEIWNGRKRKCQNR